MAEIRVTLSANAGICVQIDNQRIWVDVLHQEKQPGFSAVSSSLYQQVVNSEAFAAPDIICVTHCHPDHYSGEMLKEIVKRYPNAQLCLPEQEFERQILVAGESFLVTSGDVNLRFARLPHEGAQYADVKHYGLLISTYGKNILISGDCETASSVLEKAIENLQIDLAILNFPWATLTKGRKFITQILKPKHLLLCHLPFEEDDVGGFRASAQRNAQLLEDMDVRLLSEPLQCETINI